MRTRLKRTSLLPADMLTRCRKEDFAARGSEPVDDEVHLHTWMDASLRELADLVKQAHEPCRIASSFLSPKTAVVQANESARQHFTRLSFAIVYPGKLQHRHRH